MTAHRRFPKIKATDREVWHWSDVSDADGPAFVIERMQFLWPSEARKKARASAGAKAAWETRRRRAA